MPSARASLMGEQARYEGAESAKLLASQDLERVKRLAATGDRTPALMRRLGLTAALSQGVSLSDIEEVDAAP